MATLIVKSEQEAIYVSRALLRAAESVYFDAKINSVERKAVKDWLFAIRDGVKTEGVGSVNT
jgi:hypothetical protein